MEYSLQRKILEYVSGYFRILLGRCPEYARWLWEENQVNRQYTLLDLNSDLTRDLSNLPEMSLENVKLFFRRFKQRHFLRIALRDLLGLDKFQDTVRQVSDIAVVTLQTCLKLFGSNLNLWLEPEKQDNWKRDSEHIGLAVIGLGKLGGQELNYVSDIDLMFIYDVQRSGNSEDVHRLSTSAQSYLPRKCVQIIRLLEDNYEGDRVFKVDLRLRPGGKDGELVSPISYALHHYLVEGRSWERLALLKANPVAGDLSLGNLFVREIRPFVFRRFLDFQFLEEIKLLRDRILQEVPSELPGPGFNVKLGIGGIREVEFIVQSMQLIYGGRDPELRNPNTLKTLRLLAKKSILDKTTALHLMDAYVFLRKTEHWIQLMNNQSSQIIPRSMDSLCKLAFSVMYSSFDHSSPTINDAKDMIDPFLKQLRKHTDFVRSQFMEMFEPSGNKGGSPDASDVRELEIIEKLPVESSILRQSINKIFKKDLELLINTVVEEESIRRCERFLSAIQRRPGLVTFFERHPSVFELSISGVARSEFIADLVSHVPALSEGIDFDPTKEWTPKAMDILRGFDSFEEELHWLRRVKNERLLSIALYDITRNPSLEIIDRLLSELADFVISETYKMVCKHRGISWEEFPLSVCAMGKLGSKEFNYSSDLDLVFVYEPYGAKNQEIIPEKVTKLVQRFVRLLSIPLSDGPGYEVDMRLRPSGNYGPLIVTKRTWESYYRREADLWELASLLRFRPICGNRRLSEELFKMSRGFYSGGRNPGDVFSRLCELKERVEKERVKLVGNSIDIKLGKGGIMDLELWCQGTLIAWPDLIPDGSFSTGQVLPIVLSFWNLEKTVLDRLVEAFIALRRLEQRIVLSGCDPGGVNQKQLEKMKMLGMLSGSELKNNDFEWADLINTMSRIERCWNFVCEHKKPVNS